MSSNKPIIENMTIFRNDGSEREVHSNSSNIIRNDNLNHLYAYNNKLSDKPQEYNLYYIENKDYFYSLKTNQYGGNLSIKLDEELKNIGNIEEKIGKQKDNYKFDIQIISIE